MPVLQGKRLPRDYLAWQVPQNRVLRIGDWKIIAKNGDAPWGRYDLADDAGETTNLAEQQPKRLQELVARWNQWAEDCNDSR